MEKKYDLIVVGGGFAGVAAAMEAAKKGVKVLLVEKYNCLGGAAMNCLVLPFMSYWTLDPQTDKKVYLAGGIFSEILEEVSKLGGLDEKEKVFDEEIIKLVLNRMCLKYGVELLFNTTVVGAETKDGRIVFFKLLVTN